MSLKVIIDLKFLYILYIKVQYRRTLNCKSHKNMQKRCDKMCLTCYYSRIYHNVTFL